MLAPAVAASTEAYGPWFTCALLAALVSGEGVLLGFGSADPSTEERFDTIERRTYDGPALAVLRPTDPGKIRLLASAPGCEPVEVVITVEQ